MEFIIYVNAHDTSQKALWSVTENKLVVSDVNYGCNSSDYVEGFLDGLEYAGTTVMASYTDLYPEDKMYHICEFYSEMDRYI